MLVTSIVFPFLTMLSVDSFMPSSEEKMTSITFFTVEYQQLHVATCQITCSGELGYIPSCLLALYHITNFRLFQTERVCRHKWQKGLQMGRKHCGKR